ncbi:restriction endonuclease subunit S [Burkholderia pseudomallei]|uniref:restriction endonuclease subunit S n=1 Tax=Burkholderia pseudomallei TaxID=28450 RepID=UPI0005DC47CA|nr:restriction endonuclease subunit S [Burkholderia pseudomallei]CFL01684.1 restriction endonuclease S subunits-like protein [Burkholderia pseudomallei]
MKSWPKVALGDLLQPANEPARVREDQSYPNFGIYSFGRGLFAKPPINGMQTSAGTLYRVRAGNFIYSRLFAFEGSYGLVDDAFDGSFVSNEYPSFSIDRSRLEPRFLKAYFQVPNVWHAIAMGSKGVGSRRVRVQPDKVLAHCMPLPPLTEQQALVAHLDALAARTQQVEAHLDAVERDAEHLLALHFRDAIAEAPLRPMAEVAPLVRREQPIDLDGRYPELGIRSFGKGTFHKPPLSGGEVGTKRLYRIEPGDLLFSNVFAWEGAIAIAQPADAGRFGSHRFITCRADPELTSAEFLRYYFLTDEGMLKIGEASPGGAGRNRTLGLEKLTAIEVPMPSLATQQVFDRLQAHVAALKAKHIVIREANSALLPATLDRIFSHKERAHA